MRFPTTRIVTPAAFEPVSVDDAKQWAKIEHSDSDNEVARLISAAREYVEICTNRALATQTREMFPEDFPCEDEILIPFPPLGSVTAFEWTDSDSVVHSWTVSGSDLLDGSTVMAHVDIYREPGRIKLARSQSWPTETLKSMNPIRIRFTCGGADEAAIPESLKHAMYLLIDHWDKTRTAVVVGQISAIKSDRVQLTFDALIANQIVSYI